MRRTCVAVGDTNDTTGASTAEKNTDNTLSRVLSDAVVIVDDIAQDEWMNDHFLDPTC